MKQLREFFRSTRWFAYLDRGVRASDTVQGVHDPSRTKSVSNPSAVAAMLTNAERVDKSRADGTNPAKPEDAGVFARLNGAIAEDSSYRMAFYGRYGQI